MRHAIMILAHKNVGQICRLASYFSRNCDVFIHFDRKTDLSEKERSQLLDIPQVKAVEQRYKVNWGGTSVLESEMYLLRMAYKNSNAEYFHLISGQDYPVRPLDDFLDFFDMHNDEEKQEYLTFTHLPNPRWEKNTFRRFQYFYPYDLAEDKENPHEWISEQIHEQLRYNHKRPIPDQFDHLYGGSQWFSISRNATITLLDYTDRYPSFFNRMWMTFAPEECYVATVLVNHIDKKKIVNDNCRYIRWKCENGNCPANLGLEHFAFLLEGKYLFARKFEHPYSDILLKFIDRYLHQNPNVSFMTTGGWDYDGFLSYLPFDERFCLHVQRLYHETDSHTALDMGCGAGMYVAWWRRNGLNFAGYDANPNTENLSRMLLPKDDVPCGVADLTEELSINTPFDLVVCKDVLPYIPDDQKQRAIHNLAKLSAHVILVSLGISNIVRKSNNNMFSQECIISLFETEGFCVENFLTRRVQLELCRRDCYILIRNGTEILPNVR